MGHIASSLRIAAAAVLLSTTALTGAMAAGDKPASPAAAAAPADKSPAGRMTPEQADTKIQSLHAKLKIQPAQEGQWKPVADTMRQNAAALDAVIGEREQAWKTLGVIDDLKSYEKLSMTHAQGLTKLVAVFEPFYNSLSPEQKKSADSEFQGYRTRARASN